MKSYAEDIILAIATETLADAYACLAELTPHYKVLDYTRDERYIEKRYSAEGVRFLTSALPKLGEFLDGLLRGTCSERVEGFKPYDGLYPCFLRPFWMYIQSGEFCWTPANARLVRILRTLLYGLKKLNIPSTTEQIAAKLASFREIELELAYSDICPSASLQRAQTLLEYVMEGYEPTVKRPKHGPGAVAGGERGNQKWTWSTLYDSVHAEFPYYDYFYGVRTLFGGHVLRPDLSPATTGIPRRHYPFQLAAKIREYRSMKRQASPTARLLLVPKDSRGPRIISCEPKELMYLQQGAADHLENYLMSNPYTKGHINFNDQSINSNLALEASATKAWDTIDLSDASDRVGCKLLSYLFESRIVRKWLALRSTATKLPDGEVLELSKYAPMGSALCFPVESLVFWALVVASVWEQTNDLNAALDSVYVYGDDIIVKAGYTEHAIGVLESVNLKVNRQKSFTGADPFRESCGVEAYEGFDVTPYRVKYLPPKRPSDGGAITAWVKYAENSQYTCPSRSRHLLRVVERLLGPIPRVPVPQAFLSIVTTTDVWGIEKYHQAQWSETDSYWKAKLWLLCNRKRFDPIDAEHRIQHALLTRVESDPSYVVDRLSTLIRKRWATITYLGVNGI